ncbi:hypothetical protein TD95_003473 [Thielaviopsis punctulata]|uniref:Sister chromatid cohesion protein DCC1 n=1 Tax=Thielaviopsis punctulata TaxID=72032 RepID=A0A0F4Z9W0_9PEZI|nr:hypothetical protein TD95_003473 [Thielaviopsis punctulata]
MSTQGSQQIPFSHAPDGHGYRLLELPPELVALLEGLGAPLLYLETSPETANAVLRTPDHKYALRQRNTSNSIILASPTGTGTGASGDPASPGLAAFATVHESIELIRQGPDTKPGGGIGGGVRHTGSMGKWHEKFGKGR